MSILFASSLSTRPNTPAQDNEAPEFSGPADVARPPMKNPIGRALVRMAQWRLNEWYWFSLAGIFLLSLIHLVDYLAGQPFWPITQKFFLGMENNVPTWYSSGVFLLGAIVSFHCYSVCTKHAYRPAHGWIVVALVLLAMSCDEVARLHESWGGYLVTLVREVAPNYGTSWRHSGWPLVLGPILLVLAVPFVIMIWRHVRNSPQSGVVMFLGVGLVLGCGLGLESSINYLTHERHQFIWDMEIIAEETGEMLGGWMIGLGALWHAQRVKSLAAVEAGAQRQDGAGDRQAC